ncbi:hypothetical protein [Saccharothrix sp. 6-C]|uniref:hypothetical protein n=1 Tax=Saccharothrix sp. 6-C TaxID=2781735 RepID=UPI001F2A52CC|nr:hypothetical protein [Saccharothrix sp. 6-C]
MLVVVQRLLHRAGRRSDGQPRLRGGPFAQQAALVQLRLRAVLVVVRFLGPGSQFLADVHRVQRRLARAGQPVRQVAGRDFLRPQQRAHLGGQDG